MFTLKFYVEVVFRRRISHAGQSQTESSVKKVDFYLYGSQTYSLNYKVLGQKTEGDELKNETRVEM